MSAKIYGPNGTEVEVEAVSKAARIIEYDASGVAITSTTSGSKIGRDVAIMPGKNYMGQVGFAPGTQDILGALVTCARENQIEVSFANVALNTPPNLQSLVSTINTGGAPLPACANGHAVYQSGTATTGYSMGQSFTNTIYKADHEVFSAHTMYWTQPTSSNSFQWIGLYIPGAEGFKIGYQGLNWGISKLTGGADGFVNRSAFNGDPLDGSSGSLFTRNSVPEAINLQFANLFRIRFAWLGSATIMFEVANPDGCRNGNPWVTFHTILQPNTSALPSIQFPNLPITIEVSKTSADATNLVCGTACWAAGTASSTVLNTSSQGELITVGQGSSLFADDFDVFDTSIKWNAAVVVNGGTATPVNSSLVLATSTTASASTIVSSKPLFGFDGAAYINTGFIIQLEATSIINNYRFWGRGTYTGTAPTNAVGYELDTTGSLNMVIYVAGTKVFSQPYLKPTDGGFHRYDMQVRPDAVYWTIDRNNVGGQPDAKSITHLNLGGTGPLLFISANSATPPVSAPTFNVMETHVVNSAGTNLQFSDGLNPFLKGTIRPIANGPLSTDNAIVVHAIPVDGAKATYAGALTGLVPPNTPTDIFTITGSATKTIRILEIEISATQTTAAVRDILLIKRSSANTGGTTSAVIEIPYDSADNAASAVCVGYTANPTGLGTAIGTIKATKALIATTAGSPTVIEWIFAVAPAKAIVLRGVNESLCINLNSITSAGNLFDIYVTWSEE